MKGKVTEVQHRIHVFGASGSGTSTLGCALAQRLDLKHLDSDAYYWQVTDPPYCVKNPPDVRLLQIADDMNDSEGWVLSGSVVSWGSSLVPRFTVAVFITLPPAVRLQRLRAREAERYGQRIDPGGDMHEQSKAFLEWATRYDSAGPEIRSRYLHERCITQLRCPVVRVESLVPVHDLVDQIIEAADLA